MKHVKTVLTVLAISLFLGAASYATEQGSSATGQTRDYGSKSLSAADLKGEHSMPGKITDIDRDKGRVTVKTQDAGDLTLHFPSQSLANLNEGDSITVHMGFSQGIGGLETQRDRGTTSGIVPSDSDERR
jgi:hypothetical protein